MKNKEYKEQILREQYNEYCINSDDGERLALRDDGNGDGMTFREYVEREAENDPNFFRWLFDDGGLGDFDYGLSDEQKAEYNEFIEDL